MCNINVGDGFPVPPYTVVDKTGRETRPLQYFAVTLQIIYLLKYRALCIKLCGFVFKFSENQSSSSSSKCRLRTYSALSNSSSSLQPSQRFLAQPAADNAPTTRPRTNAINAVKTRIPLDVELSDSQQFLQYSHIIITSFRLSVGVRPT